MSILKKQTLGLRICSKNGGGGGIRTRGWGLPNKRFRGVHLRPLGHATADKDRTDRGLHPNPGRARTNKRRKWRRFRAPQRPKPDGRPGWLGESAKCKANVRFLQIADQNRPQTDHYLQKSHRTRGISAAPHPGDGNRTGASAQPSARIYARPPHTKTSPASSRRPKPPNTPPSRRIRPSPSTKNRPPRAVHNAPHANGRKSGPKN